MLDVIKVIQKLVELAVQCQFEKKCYHVTMLVWNDESLIPVLFMIT